MSKIISLQKYSVLRHQTYLAKMVLESALQQSHSVPSLASADDLAVALFHYADAIRAEKRFAQTTTDGQDTDNSDQAGQ